MNRFHLCRAFSHLNPTTFNDTKLAKKEAEPYFSGSTSISLPLRKTNVMLPLL